ERKDVLCAFFWMLTLLAYSCYVAALTQQRRASESRHSGARLRILAWYALVSLSFALALMSKPMAVTLPFVLLLLDFWPLGRFAKSRSRPGNEAELFQACPPPHVHPPQYPPPLFIPAESVDRTATQRLASSYGGRVGGYRLQGNSWILLEKLPLLLLSA